MKYFLLFLTIILSQAVYAQTPCIPAVVNSPASIGITNFTLAGQGTSAINDNGASPIPGNGYEDRTGVVPTISFQQGDSYSGSVTEAITNGMYNQVWIDFNDNGTFEPAENVSGLFGFTNGVSSTSFTFTVTIPITATTGTHRMRVRSAFVLPESLPASASLDPCLINDTAAGQTYNNQDGITLDYNVEITAAPYCSGTPNAGTVMANNIGACPTTQIALSLSGYDIVTGLAFQWQSSADSISWADIAGATTVTYAFSGQNSTTFYRCAATCANSNSIGYSTGYRMVETPCFCVPVYDAVDYSNPYSKAMTTFSVATETSSLTDNGPSTPAQNGYEDRTGAVSILTFAPSGSYSGTITTNNGVRMWQEVWIDFNDDGNFDSSEIVVPALGGNSTTFNFTLSIPADAMPGMHRMRVRSVSLAAAFPLPAPSDLDPCLFTNQYPDPSTDAYGMARDYDVYILPPACTGTPDAGTVSASTATGCGALTTVLSNVGQSFVSGLAYQWQSSADSTNWTSIAGETSSTYTASITTTTYYRLVDTCTNSAAFAVTPGIKLIVTPVPVPSVSVTATPGDTICAGTAVTFTALPIDGGTLPAYQWQKNGANVGLNSNIYTDSGFTNNDTVICVLTSNAACVLNATIADTTILMVNDTVTPAVSITADPGTSVTAGQSVTFTATGTNGGAMPMYQWQVNGVGISGATASTYTSNTLNDSDIIACIFTGNAPCATTDSAHSNSLTVLISSGVSVITTNISDIQLYPNPNNGNFTIAGTINNSKEAQVEVLNLVGQVVYSATVPVQNGRINDQISLPTETAAGSYFVRIKTNDGNTVLHFIKEK